MLSVGRVFACILVHTMVLGRRWLRVFSIHRRGRSGGAARSSDRLSHFVSNRLTWLAEAGGLAILAAGKPSECQLTQQADQAVANSLAGARIGGTLWWCRSGPPHQGNRDKAATRRPRLSRNGRNFSTRHRSKSNS